MKSITKLKFAAIGALILTLICCTVMAFTGVGAVPEVQTANAATDDGISAQSNEEMAALWTEAVEESLSTGKQVTFKLENDWVADTSLPNHPMGSGSYFDENGRIIVPAGANIKIDLNNHTLNRGFTADSTTWLEEGSVILVNGTLEVCDTSSAGGGQITGGASSCTDSLIGGGGIFVNGGNLILTSGTITGNYAFRGAGVFVYNGNLILTNAIVTDNKASMTGGGIFSTSDGHINTVTITGGTVSANKAIWHAGVYVRNTELEMTGCEITGNTATSAGGGLAISANTVATLDGASITNNTVDGTTSTYYGGGAIYIEQSGKLIFESGVITGNKANASGGAIMTYDQSVIIMNGGTITNNTSYYGGLSIRGGTFTMNGGTISNNTVTKEYGGGVDVSNANSTFIMNGGTITENTAQISGGGVAIRSYAKFILNDGTISDNDCPSKGGGVFVGMNTSFEMNGGLITGNTGSEYGGGVYINENALGIMNGGEISHNDSPLGGGVAINASTFTLNNGSIEYNEASWGGGVALGLSGGDCTLTITGGNISYNTATKEGGGISICQSGNSVFNMSDGEISYNEGVAYGGGIRMYSEVGVTQICNLYGGKIIGNYNTKASTASGGGIAVMGNGVQEVNLYSGLEFSDNTSVSSGGALFFYLNGNDTSCTIDGTVFRNNVTTGGSGGAIRAFANVNLTIKDIIVKDNISGNWGGGLHISTTSFTLLAGEFSGNQARRGGNDICFYGNTGDLWNVAMAVAVQHSEMQVGYCLGSNWTADTTDANHPFGEGEYFGTTGGFIVPEGANISLDLNSYKINRGFTSDSATWTTYGGVFVVNGTLEVHDSSSSGNGQITGGGSSTANYGGVYVENGHFTLTSGSITGNYNGANGAGIYALNSTIIINGGSVSENKSAWHAGVYLKGSELLMNGGDITGNTATSGGGGLSISLGAVATLNGGSITSNTVDATTSTSYGGGAMYIEQGGKLILNECDISFNTAVKGMGGAILAYDGNDVIIMNGGYISNNEAGSYGGGVCFRNGGTFEMNGGTITENKSVTYAGGVYFGASGTFTMNGGEISNNTVSGGSGGGVRIFKSTFIMNGDSIISGNTATGHGGGVIGTVESTITINSGSITSNYLNMATSGTNYCGSGIYSEGTVYMKGGTISGNTSSNSGPGTYYGAIYLHGEALFVMDGGEITANKSLQNYGGIRVADGTTFIMNGGEISGNSSTGGYGGVAVAGTFEMNGGEISGNGLGGGGYNGVSITSSGTFTMNGGLISGNKSISGVGANGVWCSGGTFTMNGGLITDHPANSSGTSGSAVYVTSTGAVFNMNGGAITGNRAYIYGAVYIAASATFNLSGGRIDNNTVTSTASTGQENVYLASGAVINITGVLHAYGANATHVGVAMQTAGTFTSGYTQKGNSVNDASTFFFGTNYMSSMSEASSFKSVQYQIGNSSGELTLTSTTVTASTTMTWKYGQYGGSMSATASNSYQSVQFDGNVYVVQPDSGSIKYSYDSEGNIVNYFYKVGVYYVTLNNPGSYNNPTFTFEILPGGIYEAEAEIIGSYVYTGSKITPKFHVTLYGTTLVEGVDYYFYSSDSVSVGKHDYELIGLGNYAGSSCVGKFEILPRNLNATLAETTAVYTGKAIIPNIIVEGLVGNDSATVDYKIYVNDNGVRGGEVEEMIDAGAYFVVLSIADNDNYVLVTSEFRFSVSTKSVAVIWDKVSFVYNGAEQKPSAYFLDVDGNRVDIPDVNVASAIEVSNYTASVSKTVYGNYETVASVYNFSIGKATVSINWSGDELTYDGSEQAIAFTITGVNGEDLSSDVTIVYYLNGVALDGVPVNAGVYLAKATLTNNSYELASDSAEYSYTILKGELLYTYEYSDEFNGEGKAPEFDVTDAATGAGVDVVVLYAVDGSDEYSEELPVNVGKYVAKLTDENGNYEEVLFSFEITALEVSVVWSLDEQGVLAGTTYKWLYDGSAHAPSASAEVELAGTTVKLELEALNGATAAGAGYTVTAVLADTEFNGNFILTNDSVKVEIVASTITDVLWYEHGSTTALEAGAEPSFKYISVNGTTGPGLVAYGVATLTGKDENGADKTVTAHVPLTVEYPDAVRDANGFWKINGTDGIPANYTANAKLVNGGTNCSMHSAVTNTTLKFYVTDLSADVATADVRWVVEMEDGTLVDAHDYVFTYNGAPAAIMAIVVYDAEKFEADSTDSSSYEVLTNVRGIKTDVGTYYAYVLPCDLSIAPEDSECRYTIKPINITIDWIVGTYTYDGTEQKPLAQVSGTGGVPCTVTVEGFVEAGTHTAVAVVSKNFNIVSGAEQVFTIDKLTLNAKDVVWSLTGGTAKDVAHFVITEDGNMHTPTATLHAIINGKSVEIKLSVTGSASNVGTHYAYAILSNEDKVNFNYIFAGSTARFDIISDSIATIYWVDGAGNPITNANDPIYFTYNGEAQKPQAYYRVGNEKVYLNVIGEGTEAGTYVAYITDDLDFVDSTKHTFVIKPVELDVTWTNTEFNYMPSAALQKPSVSFTDADGETVVLSEKLDYIVTGFANAGTHTAEIFLNNSNYVVNNPTCDITINPYAIDLNWFGNDNGTFEWSYDGDVHAPTATVKDSSIKLTVSVIGGESGVGSYTAIAVIDSENYTVTNPTHDFEILAFAITVSWYGNDDNGKFEWTYDGVNAFAPTATYKDWNGDTQTLEIMGARIDAGEYTATAVLPENCRFLFENGENAGEHAFTVSRLLLTSITWYGNDDDGSFVWEFDGEAHCPTAEAGTVTIVVTGSAVNAGEYTATAEPANATNYAFADGVEVTKTYTISPKTVVVDWDCADGEFDDDMNVVWSYDGKTHVPVATFEDVDGKKVDIPVSGATANAGEYTAKAQNIFVNYTFSNFSDTQNFKITYKEVTAVWSSADYNADDEVYEFEFNGRSQQPTAAASGVDFAYVIKSVDGSTVSTVSAAINAGEYTVTVIAKNSNYTVSKDSQTVKMVIKAKTVTVQWGNDELTYTGEAQAPEAWFEDVNGQKVVLAVSGAETDAGEDYTAKASFVNANGNYALVGETHPFSISGNSGDGYYWDWNDEAWKVVEPDTDADGSDANP